MIRYCIFVDAAASLSTFCRVWRKNKRPEMMRPRSRWNLTMKHFR